MAVMNLSGAGVVSLTPGTTHLFIEVIVFGAGISTGLATPPNYYGLGLLRIGRHGAYYPAIPIDATDQIVDVPPGADGLGYSLLTTTSIRVTEDNS